MVIKITKNDIREMVTYVAKQLVNEEAGAAKDWVPVFEYIANEIWNQLIKGSKRLKDKLRKDGSVLKRGERRGPTEAVIVITPEKLRELDRRGRLLEVFPNGLKAKNYVLSGYTFGKACGWIKLKEGLIAVGISEHFLPIEGDGEKEKQIFIDSIISVGMHEITHGLNGEPYVKNYSNDFFRDGRKDRPWGGGFDRSNPHDIAYDIEYLFKPGEMNARVSGFYFGAMAAMKKVDTNILQSKESIKKDIETLNKGKYLGDSSSSMYMLPLCADPRIDSMASAIKKLAKEEYGTYSNSVKHNALYSAVACLLSYPEGIINVRKYGKITEKGRKSELKKGIEPKSYSLEVIVHVTPEDGYRIENAYTVVDKDGNYVGTPLPEDIYEHDENGKILYTIETWGSQNQYKTKTEVKKKEEDIKITGFKTHMKMSGDEFKSRFGDDKMVSGNLEIIESYPNWEQDDYDVPYGERVRFSDKIVDEETFEAIKADMVRQLSEKLEAFKKRIYKVYYMALSDTINDRNSNNENVDSGIKNTEN